MQSFYKILKEFISKYAKIKLEVNELSILLQKNSPLLKCT